MTPYYEDQRAGIAIYCGDALRILPVLDFDVAIFDPPYGIRNRSRTKGRQHGNCAIAGDESTEVRDAILEIVGTRPSAVFGSWKAPRPAEIRALLIWEKGEHVGMGDLSLPWKQNTEEIYILGAGWHGRRRGSVLRHLAPSGCLGSQRGTRHHPNEKPETLMGELIACAPPGIIIDPTMGSGSTLVSAKALGRRAIGIELTERHCATAVRRLSQEVLALHVPPRKRLKK